MRPDTVSFSSETSGITTPVTCSRTVSAPDFQSILFKERENSGEKRIFNNNALPVPSFFADLNLDQIINTITAGREEYNLKTFFYTSLNDIATIKYRQEITHDLENELLFENIKSFTQKMVTIRRYLALVEKLYYKYHKEGWFLEAADMYCDAVSDLVSDLSAAYLKSQGFLAFREYITSYVNSNIFLTLLSETKKLKSDLADVKYSVLLKSNGGKVQKLEDETDYSIDVENTFQKFKQGAVKNYTVKLTTGTGMNHVEAKILELVARLYPEIFSTLDNYFINNRDFPNKKINTFDREVQFYISYLDYISVIKKGGLEFCYPEVSNTDKDIFSSESFDTALAHKLVTTGSPVVVNDFYMKDKERILVISGPNQGGKTTFARTFGQLHFLASLGLPVPGREEKLFLFDKIFTHFEKEEDINNLRGKLQDDLIRIHDIIKEATSNSIIIMNEIFTSTTLKDGIFLSKKIIDKIMELDCECVLVTFMDELSSLSGKTVSMVSTVTPDDPTLRTYKIMRKPADGLAYALSIAEKYRLTSRSLKGRIKP